MEVYTLVHWKPNLWDYLVRGTKNRRTPAGTLTEQEAVMWLYRVVIAPGEVGTLLCLGEAGRKGDPWGDIRVGP